MLDLVLRRDLVLDVWHSGSIDGSFMIGGAVEDQFAASGTSESAELRARVSAEGVIVSVAASPHELDVLHGQRASGGLRRALSTGGLGPLPRNSAAAALVDDVSVLWLFRREVQRRQGAGLQDAGVDPFAAPVGICAGWVAGGTLHEESTRGLPVERETVVEVRRRQRRPLPPDLRRRPGAVRRHRTTEVGIDGDGGYIVDAWMRDAYCVDAETDSLMHELHVTIRTDRDGVVRSAQTGHGRLPVIECRQAAASAERLLGIDADDVDVRVRDEFGGAATCTHLNDVYRSASSALLRVRSTS